jgi:hypothetical protein
VSDRQASTEVEDFKQAVNMSADRLRSWLDTAESQEVGQKDGSDESIGHKSGRRIIELLNKSTYTDDDISHMQKVTSYIRRHSAQRPSGDIENTHWRFSLMNWGHDPLKEPS